MIRQRTKNIIFSVLLGFLIANILIFSVYLIAIRGNEELATKLIGVEKVEKTKEIIEKSFVYTVGERVKAGVPLTNDMLRKIEIENSKLPQNIYINKDELLGKCSKIDLEPNMLLTNNMFVEKIVLAKHNEIVELKNMRIASIVKIGDIVNIRIHFKPGQDYIVLNDKEVKDIDEEANTLFVKLKEEEILAYSSALEDLKNNEGTEIYVTETSGILEKDVVKYPNNMNVLKLNNSEKKSEKIFDERMALDAALESFYSEENNNYEKVKEEVKEDITAKKIETEKIIVERKTEDKTEDKTEVKEEVITTETKELENHNVKGKKKGSW